MLTFYVNCGKICLICMSLDSLYYFYIHMDYSNNFDMEVMDMIQNFFVILLVFFIFAIIRSFFYYDRLFTIVIVFFLLSIVFMCFGLQIFLVTLLLCILLMIYTWKRESAGEMLSTKWILLWYCIALILSLIFCLFLYKN